MCFCFGIFVLLLFRLKLTSTKNDVGRKFLDVWKLFCDFVIQHNFYHMVLYVRVERAFVSAMMFSYISTGIVPFVRRPVKYAILGLGFFLWW